MEANKKHGSFTKIISMEVNHKEWQWSMEAIKRNHQNMEANDKKKYQSMDLNKQCQENTSESM